MKTKSIEIQLPKDYECRRCVLIVIENHIGIIEKTIKKGGIEYALVKKYKEK